MARQINKLSAAFVTKTTEPGMYGDGLGLWLQVSKWQTKSWVFRYQIAGRPRTMGLGSVDTFTLKEARERATEMRKLVATGIDPIDQRKAVTLAAKAEAAKAVTFKQAAERYIAAHTAGWKSPKHADQWAATLTTYAFPVIGNLSVASIDTGHVTGILEPIWNTKTETANRVRGRIEAVLDWAAARKLRSGENPARWRGHLDKLLVAPSKIIKVEHHAAMPFDDVPAFIASLRENSSISACALEFTILTAARTGETLGMTDGEIDFESKVWTIPAERMKAGREHRVPLCDRALEILRTTPRAAGSQYMFCGARKCKPMSNMAMLMLLRGIKGCEELTVHGFRSAFRDWAGERTNFPREVAEAALAHTLRDKTEAAYRRGDALEKRRRLMQAWEGFIASPARGAVLPMRATA